MPWMALHIEVEAAHADAMTDALLAQGAQSVSTEDVASGTPGETPQFAEPGFAEPHYWTRNRVTALVDPATDWPALVAAAARQAGLASTPAIEVSRVADEDWVRSSQLQFGPLRIGRLWIGPNWCDPPGDPAVAVLRLDPGLAFGTGSHPTTRLALGWLESILQGGEAVLDYGCGSGILALAAARLGAANVTAVDIDPLALQSAASNALANGIRLNAVPPGALPRDAFDVVVANILARPLIALAPDIAFRARHGARLALSGILRPQVDEVIAAYAPFFELRANASEEGWQLVAGVRR